MFNWLRNWWKRNRCSILGHKVYDPEEKIFPLNPKSMLEKFAAATKEGLICFRCKEDIIYVRNIWVTYDEAEKVW